eukprot:gene27986-36875_t
MRGNRGRNAGGVVPAGQALRRQPPKFGRAWSGAGSRCGARIRTVLGNTRRQGIQAVVLQLVVQFVQKFHPDDFTVRPFGAQSGRPTVPAPRTARPSGCVTQRRCRRNFMPELATPCALIVMGVAGSGKSTVAEALAARLGWRFADADGFHPASNVAKMSAGHPLTDDDRWPWLRAIAAEIASTCQ